jgi:hypothetical protein
MEHPVTIKIYVTVQGREPFTEWLHRIKDATSRVPLSERGSIESGWAISGIVIPLAMVFMNFA